MKKITQILDRIIRINNGKKGKYIPLHQPSFRSNEEKYVLNTIKSTFVSSVGEYVNLFEKSVSRYTQTKEAIALVNGTSALQIALRIVGVKENDEVITQALTFVATANAIAFNGAKPIFLDVDYDTMGLSPDSVENFLFDYGEVRKEGCFNKKTGKKISACVPMHTFGFPVNMDRLIEVCKNWNIPIVEDAAESLGSKYKNNYTGSMGSLGVFSFNGNKIITSGGGGAIITNSIKFAKKAKHISTTAKKPNTFEFYHDQLGYNFRMPNINAALAFAQMEQLEYFISKKRILAKTYEEYFRKEGIVFRKETTDTRSNYWLMCIELENLKERNSFLEVSNKNKITTRPIWKLLFKLPMYKDCYRDNQSNASFLEKRILNIPSSVI